ncbi:ras-like protein 1 [Macrotis lagotis]|uniref:ras-like protein 1 n=1 Tax=Macrotis lagotis TaxID=92651 RepID=UPI003D69FCAE
MTPYKLVVLGSSGTAKSALIIRFLQNRFVEQCEPTVNHLYEGQLVVDGEPCELAIMDTSGRELYWDLREDCIRWGQGFLFVYSVDSFITFMDMTLFQDQLRKVKGTSRVPMVLVANKVDEAYWMVDSELGQDAAKNFGVPYVETSAKTGQGVEQAFEELVREIRLSQDQGRRSLAYMCVLPQTPSLEFPVYPIKPGNWVLIKTWRELKLHRSC